MLLFLLCLISFHVSPDVFVYRYNVYAVKFDLR